ncbi:DUF4352 domain-containing protein [Streptomyces sp. NPDC054956]
MSRGASARVRAALPLLLAALLLGPAPPGAGAGPGPGPDGSGETVSLSGDAPGERLDVTLTQVVDPASGPAPGDTDRLVSVRLLLENTGTAVYEDNPAPAAHLLDSRGRRFTGLNRSTDAGAAFPDTVTLNPGDSADGFVTFRLPRDAALAAVQFALNRGLAHDVGHWSLS